MDMIVNKMPFKWTNEYSLGWLQIDSQGPDFLNFTVYHFEFPRYIVRGALYDFEVVFRFFKGYKSVGTFKTIDKETTKFIIKAARAE